MSDLVLIKDITEMVKNNGHTEFVEYGDGRLTYRVFNPVTDAWYHFDIPVEETKGGIFPAREKVIYQTRWIRRAINTNQFRKEWKK